MSQPIDPWSHLRHRTEETDRLLRNRRRRNDPRVTVRTRSPGQGR
ncbi:hypothetical protein SAMN04515671_2647 [Nakamurella panacisegetis]|uniref:Uncharacterized protein n=1 Tax=Nakamurella panacisegetis TaxID=1090615 RepID=A0A1H0P6X0_9ACTN|nr:hypothetical protein SAMN04515671_2647 [Nakamurella panacisegetis]